MRVELAERRPDRLLAVVHVVGVADRVIAAEDEGLRGRERRVETLALHRVPGGRLVEAALEVAEQHVGLPQRVLDRARTAPCGSVTFMRFTSPVSISVRLMAHPPSS